MTIDDDINYTMVTDKTEYDKSVSQVKLSRVKSIDPTRSSRESKPGARPRFPVGLPYATAIARSGCTQTQQPSHPVTVTNGDPATNLKACHDVIN